MARKTNMAKALKKREEEKSREDARKAMMRRRATYWTPKEGTNKFRLLPPWTEEGPNAEQFWREIHVHFGVMCFDSPDSENAFSVSCPKHTEHAAELLGLEAGSDMACPVCEAITALKQSQDPADAEMAKNARAKQRFYSNIMDLNDPTWTKDAIDAMKGKCPEDFLPKIGDPKVQVYTYGTQVMNMMLDFFSDNTDITDLVDGRDLTLEREGTGIKTKYRLRPNLEKTEAPISEDQFDEHIEDLDKVMPFFSTEQMDAILAGASAQEVFALTEGSSEAEALPEGEETEEPAGELPESTEDEQPEDGGEEEEQATADESEEWPPVDSDGDIDWAKLSDEQIEDSDNEDVTDGGGVSVYLNCFGAARQRDPDDEDCKDNCGLFERCGKRIAFLDAEEERKKKEAAAKKKGPGKKGPGKKAAGKGAGKKTAGKSNGSSKPKAAKKPSGGGGTMDDLEAEMKAALGK
jgi:hypothetical protein